MIWNLFPQREFNLVSDVLLPIPWCCDGGEAPYDLFEIVCRYYGYPAHRLPWWDVDAESSARGFIERAERVGLKAHVLRGSRERLFQWLQDGVLPLARLCIDGEESYVAVTGLRDRAAGVRIGKSVEDQRWISMSDFQQQWRAAGSETILITERPVSESRAVCLPEFSGALPFARLGLAA